MMAKSQNISYFYHIFSLQTRILVTHGLTYLPRCDRVVVMSDGRISEIGTYMYAELLNSEGGFAQFVRNCIGEEADSLQGAVFQHPSA